MAPPAALVTGAAAGIGKAITIALVKKGYGVTMMDIHKAQLDDLAMELRALVPKASILAVQANVASDQAQRAAFDGHMRRFGRLDVAILNAGIGERGDVFGEKSDWKLVVDIDLNAVIEGMRLSAGCMSNGGAIITIASASALYPMPMGPVYAASKAGVMQLSRSAAPTLKKRGIKMMCICPEFVDTNLVKEIPDVVKQVTLISPSHIADAAMKLLQPESKPGTVLLIRQDGRVVEPFQHIPIQLGGLKRGTPPNRPTLTAADPARVKALSDWAAGSLPHTYRKVQVHKLSPNFREATRVIEAPLPKPPPGQVLLRRAFVSINASDINFSSGRYHKNKAEAEAELPFDAGFDAVNVVAAVGPGVSGLSVGDPVATLSYGGFAEYALSPAQVCMPIIDPSPETAALLTSGLTASIALEQCGKLKSGETVLVTAAAGGTGQFAVQLAKLAGCHVIATCGGQGKVAALKALGADRVVDYTSEKLKDVLKKEYPMGVDVVFESVGGDMFAAAVDGLAHKGRLIVIGMMSSYAEGWPPGNYPGLCEKLLWKSASVSGFFLLRHAHLLKQHLAKLVQLMSNAQLQVPIDQRKFVGLEDVADAVEYLHSGRSIGKVVVQLHKIPPPLLPATSVSAPRSRL